MPPSGSQDAAGVFRAILETEDPSSRASRVWLNWLAADEEMGSHAGHFWTIPFTPKPTMACREFTDAVGRYWVVWDVYPTLAERRHRNAGPPPGTRDRRRFIERRAHLRHSMTKGWLAFEAADGERRRLAPIPEMPGGWAAATPEQLREWCTVANPAPPARRLIE
jgi:hypothetical protein